MNIMCNLTQFVIAVPVPIEKSSTLTEYFVQYVLLKFGICHFVVLDDGSPFIDVFSTIRKAFCITYNSLAKRNHKDFLVEKNHKFLNKSITITVDNK